MGLPNPFLQPFSFHQYLMRAIYIMTSSTENQQSDLSKMPVWLCLPSDRNSWVVPMPLGKFQNPSTVCKTFQNLDSAHLHSYNSIIPLLFQSPVVVPQTSYAELFLTTWTQGENVFIQQIFNYHLLSGVVLCPRADKKIPPSKISSYGGNIRQVNENNNTIDRRFIPDICKSVLGVQRRNFLNL